MSVVRKIKSKIFRKYSAARKKLKWYFMLLIKNKHPIGQSKTKFTVSAYLCVWCMLNALVICTFSIASWIYGEESSTYYIFTLLVATFSLGASCLNFNDMVKAKLEVYNMKVAEATESWKFPYSCAVLKLAAMHPELELDQKTYNLWKDAAARKRLLFDADDALVASSFDLAVKHPARCASLANKNWPKILLRS